MSPGEGAYRQREIPFSGVVSLYHLSQEPKNPQEFMRLYVPHRDIAYNFALKILKNPADAEDALQTSLFKAYAAFGDFKRGTNFRGWFLAIVHNTAIDYLKKRPRETSYDNYADPEGGEVLLENVSYKNDDHHLWGVPSSRSGLRKVMSDEFTGALEQALTALPQEQSETFRLRMEKELSYDEIARMMEVPEGTAKFRMYEAIRKLKLLLSEFDPYREEASAVPLEARLN